MFFATLGDIQLNVSLELWILRVVVVAMGIMGFWLLARERLRRGVASGEGCPHCGANKLHRIHRKSADRIFGLGLNVHRYRCNDPACRWEGLKRSHPSASRRWRRA